MIDLKDEFLFDFSVRSSRILITEKIALIDNIIRLVDFSDTMLIVQSSKTAFTEIRGENILISSFQGSRIICSGKIKSVEFYNKGNDTK